MKYVWIKACMRVCWPILLYSSGVSIIADVAESIAETQPISINRIEIWDRLIGKNSKRTSLQNC